MSSGNNSSSVVNSGGGGICSVLLEVIEKLRDEESSSAAAEAAAALSSQAMDTSPSNPLETPQKQHKHNKRKQAAPTGKFDCKRLIKKAKLNRCATQSKHKLKPKSLLKKRKRLPQSAKSAKQAKKEADDEEEEAKECKIETSIVNSIFDDDATILNNNPNNNKDVYETEVDFYFKTASNSSTSTSSPSSSSSSSSSTSSLNSYENAFKTNAILNSDLYNLLLSLASNENHDEQYVCCMCSYVCFHLPSLKSHMWSHVKSIHFDYSVNTSIINAALDYENKLNRKLNSIRKAILAGNYDIQASETNRNVYSQRLLSNALELINYPQQQIDKLTEYQANKSSPMVSFRCSRCAFESIDLSVLRLHKREHVK